MIKNISILLLSFCMIFGFSSCVEKSDGPDNPYDNKDDNKDDGKIGEIVAEGYADLGLSVKWAACNLGANSPQEAGTTYSWGDQSTNCELDICGTEYDQASAVLGKDWQLPSYDQMKELVSKCSWTYTKYRGIYGYAVTGPSGNAIFLTNGTNSNDYYTSQTTYYWSGTCDVFSNDAYVIGIEKNSYSSSGTSYKISKQSRGDKNYIRPVYVGK